MTFIHHVPIRSLIAVAVAGTLAGSALTFSPGHANAATTAVESSYTSTDNGDGTYTVPLTNSDIPDVSVERLPKSDPSNHDGRDAYYMVSTTMHLSPGAPIMKSFDLVNWHIVNYVYNRVSISDASSLRNGSESYGQGQWASSLRHHGGKWYVLYNTNNLGGAYIAVTTDIENGSWTRSALGVGLHDPSLFFDGDTGYIFFGGGTTNVATLNSTYTAIASTKNAMIQKSDFPNDSFVTTSYEGQQVFKIGDYYYIVAITWPSGGNRQEIVFRSKYLLGKYDPANTAGTQSYEVRSALNSDGFAQGSLVEVAKEDGSTAWHGFFFRDTYPIGRMPALIPATWTDGWPTFGNNGSVNKGGSFAKLITLPPALDAQERQQSVVASDDFANDAAHKSYVDDETWTISAPTIDESKLGVELVTNGTFETGDTSGWAAQYGATISASTADQASGTTSLFTTGRKLNGAAAYQSLAGKVQAGVTYKVSVKVKYVDIDCGSTCTDSSGNPVTPTTPATATFKLTIDLGSGVKDMATATVTKGTWTTISGTYAIPSGTPVTTAKLAIETPWSSTQPASSYVPYYADDFSVIGQPITTESATAAEVNPNGSYLDMAWEWNHDPDNRYWSLTDRPGWLRLTTGKVVTGAYTYAKLSGKDELTYFEEARNTLSQRTFGPKQSAETRMDISRMKDGDTAGIAAYTRAFTYAAVKRIDGVNKLGIVNRNQPFTASIDQDALETFTGTPVDLGNATTVALKADLDSTSGSLIVKYYYSLNDRDWTLLGTSGAYTFDWSLSHFMGYRVGLFNYAGKTKGGSVDFDYFYLSKVLTADGKPISTTSLDSAIGAADALAEADYTGDATAWSAMRSALAAAKAAKSAGFSTQNQVDAFAVPLQLTLSELAAYKESTVAPDALSGASVGEVGRDAATVSVTVDPAGFERTVSVELDPVAGAATPVTVAGDAASAVVKLPLSGLTPGTAYRVRVVSASGLNTEYGEWLDFTTSTMAASIGQSAISGVGTRQATVSALVTPGDADQKVWVEYSAKADHSGAVSTEKVALPKAVDASTLVFDLEGLAPATSFSYRVVAQSADGVKVAGDWIGFSTAAVSDPVVSLTATPATARVGEQVTLTWTSEHADSLTAAGDWNGAKATSGSQKVTLTRAGTAEFALTGAGEGGKVKVSALVTVSLPAKALSVSTQRAPQYAGGAIPVSATGLASGEPYAVSVAGITVASGVASTSGSVNVRVQVPPVLSVGTRQVVVTGSTSDRAGSTTIRVVGSQKLTVKASAKSVKRGKKLSVTVKRLAAYEPVTVTVAGQTVRGTASASGTFSTKITISKKAKKGKKTLVATGLSKARSGSVKVTIK